MYTDTHICTYVYTHTYSIKTVYTIYNLEDEKMSYTKKTFVLCCLMLQKEFYGCYKLREFHLGCSGIRLRLTKMDRCYLFLSQRGPDLVFEYRDGLLTPSHHKKS